MIYVVYMSVVCTQRHHMHKAQKVQLIMLFTWYVSGCCCCYCSCASHKRVLIFFLIGVCYLYSTTVNIFVVVLVSKTLTIKKVFLACAYNYFTRLIKATMSCLFAYYYF